MSNDHIFAAQMWSWTDPVIKRDSHGRILVVNAAFLQLYGGTVEAWTGNPIDGWPAPKSPGEMSRFESRIPLPTGGETVYDWMECTHQDGTAVAMARDVTVYAIAQQAPAEPVAPAAYTEAASANVTPVEAAPMMEADNQSVQNDLAGLSPIAQSAQTAQPPAPEIAPQPEIAQQVAAAPAPIEVSEPAAPIAAPVAVAAATVATAAAATIATAQPAEPVYAAPAPVQTHVAPAVSALAAPAAPAPQMEAPVAPQPVQAVADAAPVQTEERAYEKRALPIENDDAILGNNWRDAVIAKAVGVEDDTANAEADSEAPAASTNSSGEQIRVLLAEDNAINALLTRTLLEADGCHCDVVEDGALAVEAVKNNAYDLVFMDMRMPNMDGLEATRKIRSMGHNAKTLPIVALTANAFDDDRNACFDSGMNDFMTKPVSAEELSAMVKTHTTLEAEKLAS